MLGLLECSTPSLLLRGLRPSASGVCPQSALPEGLIALQLSAEHFGCDAVAFSPQLIVVRQ